MYCGAGLRCRRRGGLDVPQGELFLPPSIELALTVVLKDDEIIVLMQLPVLEAVYLVCWYAIPRI
jgi:hypothetical protein